jgi:hypothetical protein
MRKVSDKMLLQPDSLRGRGSELLDAALNKKYGP